MFQLWWSHGFFLKLFSPLIPDYFRQCGLDVVLILFIYVKYLCIGTKHSKWTPQSASTCNTLLKTAESKKIKEEPNNKSKQLSRETALEVSNNLVKDSSGYGPSHSKTKRQKHKPYPESPVMVLKRWCCRGLRGPGVINMGSSNACV